MSEDIFPVLNNFFTKEIPVRDFQLKNSYMIIKFLSLYPGTFDIADKANRLSTRIPDWGVSYFLFYSIPKSRPPRTSYPKSEKTKQWQKELLTKVMQIFFCNADHAEQILEILSRTDKKIIETFGVEINK